MVDFSTILQFIQATGIIVGVAYYVLNIENNRKNQELAQKTQQQHIETRQAQLFLQLVFQLYSTEFIKLYFELLGMEWDDYKDYQTKYGVYTNPDAFAFRHKLHENLNLLGTYLKKDLIDIELINQTFGGVVIRMWHKWKDVIEHERTQLYTQNYMKDFEFLYNEIVKHREKIGQEIDDISSIQKYVPAK